MKINQRVFNVFFLLIFFYLFILQLYAIWPFTIDDMYISLRYANHWWAGYGLVWNQGMPPVEGFSNFSFVVLGRLSLSLGMDPVLALKTAGIVGLFGTCMAIFFISRFWFRTPLAFIPCCWLLAYKGEILWSVSGLETTVYQALLASSIFFIFYGLGYSLCPHPKKSIRPWSFVLAGIFMIFASMTRPEAPVFVLLFTFLLFFNSSFIRKPFLRSGIGKNARHRERLYSITLFTGTFALGFVPYFLWRWHYFGQFFPNPVYCKGLTSFSSVMLDKNYIQLVWPFFLLALPAFLQKDRRYYFLFLPSVLYLFLLIGADPVVAFSNRLFLPAFVFMLPLALQGMNRLLNYFLQEEAVVHFALFIGSFLVIVFFIPMLTLSGYRAYVVNPLKGERLRQEVITWLKEHVVPESQVVLADSGLIPYKTSYQFIDSYCLNNKDMSKPPRKIMYQRLCEEVIANKPDVVILTALIEQGKVIYTPADACLAQKFSNGSGYCLQTQFSSNNPHSSYRYEIFKGC
jgi:hypothetical protein